MQNNKNDYKKQIKRTMWFILAYAIVALVISSLLIIYTSIPQWLNMIIVVLLAGAFYLLFLGICAIIDKKKKQKQEKSPTDDPFVEE